MTDTSQSIEKLQEKYLKTRESETFAFDALYASPDQKEEYFSVSYNSVISTNDIYTIIPDMVYSVGQEIPAGYYEVNIPISVNGVIIGNKDEYYCEKYKIGNGYGDDSDGSIENGSVIELLDGENVIGIDAVYSLVKADKKEKSDIQNLYIKKKQKDTK